MIDDYKHMQLNDNIFKGRNALMITYNYEKVKYREISFVHPYQTWSVMLCVFE